jgi:hypothetical protein
MPVIYLGIAFYILQKTMIAKDLNRIDIYLEIIR